jgi:hypothetical protein
LNSPDERRVFSFTLKNFAKLVLKTPFSCGRWFLWLTLLAPVPYFNPVAEPLARRYARA